jgi:uncharacterized protein
LRARHLLLMAWLVFPAMSQATDLPDPTIAIIIDDMGNQYENGAKLVALPYPLTLSFLPKRPFTQELSAQALAAGKELMLHAPMENSHGLRLGYGGLTTGMNQAQIRQVLNDMLNDVPHIRGVNNHMGSLLTQQAEVMGWIMDELRQHPFYFVDSRTSAATVAHRIALEHQVPSLNRDVFLDHEPTRDYFDTQFKRLLDLARKNGTAIAIAHPHDLSVRYLETVLPTLDEKGIRIATVSALWQIRHPDKVMFADRQKPLNLAQQQSTTTAERLTH